MSARVLLNLLNEMGKRDKMRGFFSTRLINLMKHCTNVIFFLSCDIKIL